MFGIELRAVRICSERCQRNEMRIPENLTAQIPEIMAGSSGTGKTHTCLSSGSGSARSGSLGQGEFMYSEQKRREPGRALTGCQDDQRSVLIQFRHQVMESSRNEGPDS